MRSDEREIMDAVVVAALTGESEWLSARQVAEKLGYEFKTIVWSLTRLSKNGSVCAKVEYYPVPYRRGSGECRYLYRLLPEYLRPQAMRGEQ